MQRRKTDPTDIKISVTVSQEVWERLRLLATRQRRSLNDLLNEWISAKLAPESNPELPPEEGRKGGEFRYSRPDLRTASALCDRE